MAEGDKPRAPVPGSRWFRLGAWLAVLTAVGHTLGNHTRLGPPPTPELQLVIDAMKRVILPVSGKSFWLAFVGDSLTMGVMFAGFGASNLLFERALRRRGEPVPLGVLVANILVTIVCLVITALCFPPQPLVGTIVALFAYVMALKRVLTASR